VNLRGSCDLRASTKAGFSVTAAAAHVGGRGVRTTQLVPPKRSQAATASPPASMATQGPSASCSSSDRLIGDCHPAPAGLTASWISTLRCQTATAATAEIGDLSMPH
jgi:hypothetical protein